MDYSPVIKLGIVIVLIVLGLRRKLPLGLVMVGAALLLGFLFQVAAGTVVMTLLGTVVDSLTLELVGILTLVMILEKVLQDQGVMEEMVAGVRRSIKNPRLAVTLLPTLIGLLPSAGGALFSCPLVDQVAEEMELSPEVKSYINYWFRHIWEYSFPLYPAIILTAGVVGMGVTELIPYLLPFTLIALLVGVLFLRSIAGDKLGRQLEATPVQWQDLLGICKGLAPILVTVLLVIVFKLPVVLSLALAVGGLLLYRRYNWAGLAGIIRRLDYRILLSVVGIMMFKEMLITSGMPAVLPEIMLGLNLPPLLIVAAVPFLLGMLMGLSSGFIGVGFPLLMSLLGGTMDPAYIIVAYISGLTGIMVSPMHLCMLLTIGYFRSRFGPFWRWVALSQGVMVGFAFLFFWLIPRV